MRYIEPELREAHAARIRRELDQFRPVNPCPAHSSPNERVVWSCVGICACIVITLLVALAWAMQH